MTEEQKDLKDLLIRDLCARLPYGVKVSTPDDVSRTITRMNIDRNLIEVGNYIDDVYVLSDIKPYLFPLSSMTEEHIFEINNILGKDFEIDKYGITDLIRNRRTCLSYLELDALFEYFNKYHFDYRGLIPMGLANDCTNLNIY